MDELSGALAQYVSSEEAMRSSSVAALLAAVLVAACFASGCRQVAAAPSPPRAAPQAQSGAPRIELQASRIEFGKIGQTSVMTTVTVIRNSGSAPLKILNLVGT